MSKPAETHPWRKPRKEVTSEVRMNLDERIEWLVEGWEAGDNVGEFSSKAKQLIRDVLEYEADLLQTRWDRPHTGGKTGDPYWEAIGAHKAAQEIITDLRRHAKNYAEAKELGL